MDDEIFEEYHDFINYSGYSFYVYVRGVINYYCDKAKVDECVKYCYDLYNLIGLKKIKIFENFYLLLQLLLQSRKGNENCLCTIIVKFFEKINITKYIYTICNNYFGENIDLLKIQCVHGIIYLDYDKTNGTVYPITKSDASKILKDPKNINNKKLLNIIKEDMKYMN